jgi:hypothetical protein
MSFLGGITSKFKKLSLKSVVAGVSSTVKKFGGSIPFIGPLVGPVVDKLVKSGGQALDSGKAIVGKAVHDVEDTLKKGSKVVQSEVKDMARAISGESKSSGKSSFKFSPVILAVGAGVVAVFALMRGKRAVSNRGYRR